MVQIISWTERQRHDDEARTAGRAKRRLGVMLIGREPGERHGERQAEHGREVRHLQRLDDRVQVLRRAARARRWAGSSAARASRPCAPSMPGRRSSAMFRYSSDTRDERERAQQRAVLVEALRIAEAAPGRAAPARPRRAARRASVRARRRSSDDGFACIVRDDFAEDDEGEDREDHRRDAAVVGHRHLAEQHAGRGRPRRPGP